MVARNSDPSRKRVWDTAQGKPPTETSRGDSQGEWGLEKMKEGRDG